MSPREQPEMRTERTFLGARGSISGDDSVSAGEFWPLFEQSLNEKGGYEEMKAVHFGAGNIGRGFVGLLLSQSGYDVCFVVRNPEKTALLQQRHRYTVTFANEAEDSVAVTNVTAISVNDREAVIRAVAEADIVTTAVGANVLKSIAEVIGKGIEYRLLHHPRPLNVIACENAIRASSRLKWHVYPHICAEMQNDANQYIGFPNAVVDRIVPAQHDKDPLKIKVEPFFEWIVERSDFRGAPPQIRGMQYVDSLNPYVERKIFTVNTGHCSAAYLGYVEGLQTIQEVMRDARLREKTQLILQETGELLIHKYHFDREQHLKYIRTILQRFSNRHLMDRVVRVGRSPIRKLSPDERLVRPAMQAYEHGLETPNLMSAMAAALMFDYEKDAEAAALQAAIEQNGVQATIAKFTGIPRKHPVYLKVVEKYQRLLAAPLRSKSVHV